MKSLLAAALLVSMPAYAATVSETVTYVMSDSDTAVQAREACIAQAGRQALISSGSIVDSDMEILKSEAMGKMIQRADQRIRSYVGGVVGSQVVGERWSADGGKLSVTCQVNVTFDPDEVHRLLAQVAQTLQKRQIDRIATEVDGDDVLARMDAITAKAKKVRRGMTLDEVVGYLGPWRAIDSGQSDRQTWYNWGGVWIGIRHGVVAYVSPYPVTAWDGNFENAPR
jgi:hypothetical protein